MTAQSIVDLAADLREKSRQVKDLVSQLRRDGKEWTGLAIAGEDAEAIAHSGIRHAWTMLDRIYQLALLEQGRKPTTPEDADDAR